MADHVHESWWLIEATFAPGALYYAGHRRDGKAPHMIADANRAVRFPDQDSALYTICHLLGILVGGGFTLEHMGYRVAEHIFDYTPAGVAFHYTPAPGVALPRTSRATDEEIRAWVERHDIGIGSVTFGVAASDGTKLYARPPGSPALVMVEPTDAMVDAMYDKPALVPPAGKALMREALRRALTAGVAPIDGGQR